MVKQAVILCGGRGTRLAELVNETPKPLIEVGGKPFVTYAINMLKGIGFTDIVLLIGYMKEKFESLKDKVVRLVETQEDVNKAVLSIPNLQDLFLLLNGDCFPVMDWRGFVEAAEPRVAVKIVGRDAGVAIVRKRHIEDGFINCGNIKDMVNKLENYTILGGLHVGTPQGLQRARVFFDTIVYGQ